MTRLAQNIRSFYSDGIHYKYWNRIVLIYCSFAAPSSSNSSLPTPLDLLPVLSPVNAWRPAPPNDGSYFGPTPSHNPSGANTPPWMPFPASFASTSAVASILSTSATMEQAMTATQMMYTSTTSLQKPSSLSSSTSIATSSSSAGSGDLPIQPITACP